jgi:lysophospholipase L1-like esterase
MLARRQLLEIGAMALLVPILKAPAPVQRAAGSPRGPDAPRYLRSEDRIVFLGDSITELGNYTSLVESYLVTRYPRYSQTFFNAGWAGDTAGDAADGRWGGASRLTRDVITLAPNVVTICYGMNDGYYSNFDPSWLPNFTGPMSAIIDRLLQARARPVLLTPGVVDDTVPALQWLKKITDYNNGALHLLAREVLRIARARRLPCYDLHSLMQATLERSKKDHVDMGTDGIHPDPAGGVVMAYALLKALGVPPRQERVVLDARGRESRASAGGSVHKQEGEHGPCFQITLRALPCYVPSAARKMLPYIPFIEEFNAVRLAYRGLNSNAYDLVIGMARRRHSRAELERGVLISDMWEAPHLLQAKAIGKLTQKKAELYRKYWRTLALPDNYIQNPEDFDKKVHYRTELHQQGIHESLELEAERRHKAIPEPVRVELHRAN